MIAPASMFFVTRRSTLQTFVVERACKRSRKLVVSVMPAVGDPEHPETSGDVLIEWRKVPLDIRRAARSYFGGQS